MREILFRGKSERSGEWVYGSLIVTHGGCVIYSKYHPLVTAPPEKKGDYLNQYVVDPRTVGQYTGLTDKNGKKIFEGDIARNYTGEVYEIAFIKQYSRFALRRLGTVFGWPKPKLCEVIGNIHDNPELLEVKE